MINDTNVCVMCFVCLGGKNSAGCTLILTEGDSAKTLAVSGLGVVGRDRYGVFPLRGKMLNVREASHKQVQTHTDTQLCYNYTQNKLALKMEMVVFVHDHGVCVCVTDHGEHRDQ